MDVFDDRMHARTHAHAQLAMYFLVVFYHQLRETLSELQNYRITELH